MHLHEYVEMFIENLGSTNPRTFFIVFIMPSKHEIEMWNGWKEDKPWKKTLEVGLTLEENKVIK